VEHAPQNAMTEAGEVERFRDRCSELMAALLDLKRVGRSITLVTIGGTKESLEAIPTGHIHVFNVSDEVAWNLVQKIGLKDPENN